MNFVDSLAPLHLAAKEIPCLTGKGAPTPHTEGAPGVLYMDTDTGDLYKCRGRVKKSYRWEQHTGGSLPVKGVDYWTQEDRAQIVADVIRELGGSPVFGVVGEDGSIVISGLADGSYTVKYEMEDGSTVDIGALVVGAVGPAYTNLAEPRPENTTDYTIWCSNARMGSNGTPAAKEGYTCTNFFALGNGDVIRIKGFKIERVGLYSSDKAPLPSGVSGLAALQTNSYIKAGYSQTDDFTTFTANNGNIAYARLSGWVNSTAEEVIITKNEEIA